MKTLGIIGGLGPESTVDYYRLLISLYRSHISDDSYPRFIINSINLTRVMTHVAAHQHKQLVDLLVKEIDTLKGAGVEVALISGNTPHIVFDEVQQRSPLPLISIVEATCNETKARGLTRPALFGTAFTMQAGFYPAVFENAGMSIALPRPDEQSAIHDIYINELVFGIFRPESHAALITIIDRMRERSGIDSVILGGTELPLILREGAHDGIPFLNTTKIHVEAAVQRMLS
jgi:aspartate racemase